VSGQPVDGSGFRGLYGKLPAVGDFVRRELPAPTAARLHDWVQGELGKFAGGDPAARERALERPACWRFAVSAGVLADEPGAGVLTASRDKVGRLYPCVAVVGTGEMAPGEAARRTGWFDDLEAMMLAAVAEATPLDSLLQSLRDLGPPGDIPPVPMTVSTVPGGVLATVAGPARHGPTSLAAALQLLPVPPGASVWWRETTQALQLLLVDGLPADRAFESLFDAAPSSLAGDDLLTDFASIPEPEATTLHV
jgi:type VI secretion system protein ImpM